MIQFTERIYYATNAASINTVTELEYEYVNMDPYLVYFRFAEDFGPVNIAQIIKFIRFLKTKDGSQKLILYSQSHPQKRTNALLLCCFYLLLELKMSAHDIYEKIEHDTVLLYRDAGNGPATYHISILDCMKGFERALFYNLIDVYNFDLKEYEYYEQVENGDFNWITPKFIAFASPSDKEYHKKFTASKFAEYFKNKNVQTVIRLNHKLYDRDTFVNAGLEHIEMYYPDGSCPPDYILNRFLELCDSRKIMAIHCKAGLGRTGTLIAAYLMKTYQFSASEVIGFLRVMRPGSVVGPQQNYLQAIESNLWQLSKKNNVLEHEKSDSNLPEEPIDLSVIPGQPRKVFYIYIETNIRGYVSKFIVF